MKHARHLIFLVMDRACEWSGHRLLCYNDPRWVSRLWLWAFTYDE